MKTSKLVITRGRSLCARQVSTISFVSGLLWLTIVFAQPPTQLDATNADSARRSWSQILAESDAPKREKLLNAIGQLVVADLEKRNVTSSLVWHTSLSDLSPVAIKDDLAGLNAEQIIARAEKYAASSEGQMAGTYEILVCKQACSFDYPDSAVARGKVVLFESGLSADTQKKLDQFHFGNPTEVVRACYIGQQMPDAKTFAFGTGNGISEWSLKDGTLRFELFRSVDAGYEVNLRRAENGFSGEGRSWGAGVAAPGFTPDFIVGRLTGPADIQTCSAQHRG